MKIVARGLYPPGTSWPGCFRIDRVNPTARIIIMSRLTDDLARTCSEHLLEEKWLVVPSLRVGHQWLEVVARAGRPALNVRVKTIRSMAFQLAAQEIAVRGLTVPPKTGLLLIVDQAMRQAPSGDLQYLSGVRGGLGIARVILSGINDLRLAGLTPDDLLSDRFEVPEKGRELAGIMARYMALLEDGRLIDYAGVVQLAVSRLDEGCGVPGPDLMVLLGEEPGEYTALEKRLLEAFPDGIVRTLGVEGGEGARNEKSSAGKDLDLLRWVLDPAGAPSPLGDGSVRMVRAIGASNEVRAVLRYCMAKGINWDRVEILHTDTETYVPLIYETMVAMLSPGDCSMEELPVTFSEGIPCRYSCPGRALAAWLRWIEDGFPQAGLVGMIREGLLEPARWGEPDSLMRLAALLRGVRIGRGRDRYIRLLEKRVGELEVDLDRYHGTRNREEGSGRALVGDPDGDLEGLGALMDLVSALLDCAPGPGSTPAEAVSGARRFLEGIARCDGKMDNYASLMLVEELSDMEKWLLRTGGGPGIDVMDWMEELALEARVMGSGPMPGRIHVDHVASGGHSGRDFTFILGLDDGRFPGSVRQDPLLLDVEREGISGRIPTATKRFEKKVEGFARTLARLRGEVTLSFSCYDVAEDRERFPSPFLLSVYRLLSGKVDGDQDDLLRWLPPPVSFAPAREEECLGGAEWWAWRLAGSRLVEDPGGLVSAVYPHLGRGMRAGMERAGTRFTQFDGYVPEAGRDLDPSGRSGMVMSAQRLETLGRCPLAFFFNFVLGIESPEEMSVYPGKWLDPSVRGLLLHQVFERFLRELANDGRLPEPGRDGPLLEGILREKVEEYMEICPPSSEDAFRRERRELERAARTFLVGEWLYFSGRDRRPAFFEASLGLPANGGGTPVDTESPVRIGLLGGGTMRARGRIDRVDQMSGADSERYCIWDYKTGSSRPFKPADPFQHGRRIQHYLYVEMLSRALGERVSAKARVESFGFFFPGVYEGGRRIRWTPEELRGGDMVLEMLCRIVSTGVFIATDDAKADCSFCDYIGICGDVEAVSDSTKRKLADEANCVLGPFSDLRGGDNARAGTGR